MSSETKPYLARLPIELHADLKTAAEIEGRSMNSIVEEAVAKYLAAVKESVAEYLAARTGETPPVERS